MYTQDTKQDTGLLLGNLEEDLEAVTAYMCKDDSSHEILLKALLRFK